MIKAFRFSRALALLGAMLCLLPTARAQLVINDTLNGASSSYNWAALNGACLTAGGSTVVSATNPIPACVGLGYYSGKTLVGGTTGRLPDAVGSGALRLTNGDTTTGSNGNNQTGAVVSNFTFPSNQGLQVTFKTVTYGGNAYPNSKGALSGADGISFFLSDGQYAPSVGAQGGSLGYSCSNGNGVADGVVGGYIGVGIDEFGNFTNKSDNTNSAGAQNPGQIALRGAGNTNWAALNALNSSYYPSSLSAANRTLAVQRTCRDGYLWNFGARTPVVTSTPLAINYPNLAASTLPTTGAQAVTLYSQEATNMPLRGNATPITYSLNLTYDGYLDFSYSINGGASQPVLTHQLITASNGPLPATFRFGFSSGTGGGSNVHEITCFKAAPSNIADNSAGTNVQQSTQVKVGTQIYLAYYHPTNSWGQLTATSLVTDATGTLSVASLSNWDASCVLTGGTCQSTGVATTAQASSARAMLTWSGSAGIPFQWSSLSTTQQGYLGTTAEGDLRLRYLRGDRSNEASNSGGTLRTRTGVLGDVIDSSPTWSGAPALPYAISWKDSKYTSATAPEASGSYATFTSNNATRQNIIYAGANDGFLHAFRAGYYDASGVYQGSSTTSPNDGKEVLAYMPAAILSTIHPSTATLDFSNVAYSHNFYVDGTPAVGDLYYNNAWHTWLVGGAGYGGNATGAVGDATTTSNGILFGLDVTDPSQFSESNASSLVLGEWTSATLTCANVTNCGDNLGSTVGTPIIRRLHNGNWAVLFGNGLNSKNGTAGMYVMLVNSSTGARTFRFLDTGYGPSRDPAGANSKNGLSYVTSADLDGDHIVDYVYGGDAFGNLWRFDLTSNDPTAWAAASAPMFTTTAGQPITTGVVVAGVPDTTGSGLPRIVVSFGTGRQYPQTLTSGVSYVSGTQQSLYGVWDWNLSTWSAAAAAGSKYASLTAPQTVAVSNLVTQTVTTVANSGTTSVSGGYRTVSNNPICWSGSTACSSGNNKFGWVLPLPLPVSSGEQIIYSPVLSNGDVLVNTTIPAVSQALSCDPQPASGFTMAVSVANGGSGATSFFADSNGNPLTTTGTVVAGLGLSGTGTPSIVTTTKGRYLIQQTANGSPSPNPPPLTPITNGTGTRLNWKQLR